MSEEQTFSPRAGVTIAYNQTEATNPLLPGVIFIHGYRSDKEGGKALYLEEACRMQGQAYVRFDCQGHGASSGAFTELTLSDWLQDLLDVIDQLTEGPQILVGSSMGGWLALLAAKKRPDRIAGLIGIAAAPDFTRRLYNEDITDEQRETLNRDGVLYAESDYSDEPFIITKRLIEDAENLTLLDKLINIKCHVRLIQGKLDPDVPYETALKIAEKLATEDDEVYMIEDGDHRLSRDQDLEFIGYILNEVTAKIMGDDSPAFPDLEGVHRIHY